MKVLAMGIVSTFNSQRKYFHWASQVLSLGIASTCVFLCSFVTDSSFASSEVKGVKGVIAPYGR